MQAIADKLVSETQVFQAVYVSKGENVLFSPEGLLLFQNLKHLIKPVTLENLITHRSLLHEGKLVLTGVDSWRQSKAVYVLSAFS